MTKKNTKRLHLLIFFFIYLHSEKQLILKNNKMTICH